MELVGRFLESQNVMVFERRYHFLGRILRVKCPLAAAVNYYAARSQEGEQSLEIHPDWAIQGSSPARVLSLH